MICPNLNDKTVKQ
jgi:hypothetical protein